MRTLIISLVITASVLIVADANACTCHRPDEKSGTLVCNATCTYPDVCDNTTYTEGYCYHDNVVNTCFNGTYDPCCDPSCF